MHPRTEKGPNFFVIGETAVPPSESNVITYETGVQDASSATTAPAVEAKFTTGARST